MQTGEFLAKRFAGWGHDGSVKGMTDRQFRRLITSFFENLHGLRDRVTGAADYRLMLAVDVGDDYVAGDSFQNSFDFRERRKHSGHLACVSYRYTSHATT